MTDTRQLRTTWLDYLKARWLFTATTPQDFERQLTRVVNELTGRDASLPQKAFKQVTDTYANLHSHWDGLRSERRQLDWAATGDHVKVFAWRTAQAVMIAVVVLAASYCAKELGIPLPYFRIAP